MADSSGAFPPGFQWGSSTSSHQVEGNNSNNDWWEWEKHGRTAEPSGLACDSYRRYEEDFDLARDMHHNAHRLSIEWSRIQPRSGSWDAEAIGHYRKVIAALRERKLEPVVTLHHFTNPLWVARKGGWENPEVVREFAEYCEHMALALGDKVRYWVTINEPMVYVYHGCLVKYWPPGKSSVGSAFRTMKHFAQAHCEAWRRIHAVYRTRSWESPMVGLSHAIQYLEPKNPASRADRLAVALRERLNNRLFLKLIWHSASYLPAYLFGMGGETRSLDFIGLNYYFREIIASKKLRGVMDLVGDASKTDERFLRAEKSDLDWEIYPEGLYRVLQSLKPYDLPVLVTENGICTQDEGLRARFIRTHLEQVRRALKDGVRVIGYHYWSLLDNFEWSFGFKPRFGLVHVDFASQKRTPKESSRLYSDVCRRNALPADSP